MQYTSLVLFCPTDAILSPFVAVLVADCDIIPFHDFCPLKVFFPFLAVNSDYCKISIRALYPSSWRYCFRLLTNRKMCAPNHFTQLPPHPLATCKSQTPPCPPPHPSPRPSTAPAPPFPLRSNHVSAAASASALSGVTHSQILIGHVSLNAPPLPEEMHLSSSQSVLPHLSLPLQRMPHRYHTQHFRCSPAQTATGIS